MPWCGKDMAKSSESNMGGKKRICNSSREHISFMKKAPEAAVLVLCHQMATLLLIRERDQGKRSVSSTKAVATVGIFLLFYFRIKIECFA